VLLLRGPQTPGELRTRTERMHRFDEIGEVLAGLQKLMEREPPLAAVLPRQPGMKESRYAHLLSGAVEALHAADSDSSTHRETAPIAGSGAGQEERIAQLETAFAELQQEMAALRKKIDDLFGE
jgi:uncharacterized protein YceH (UPF0502 family)